MHQVMVIFSGQHLESGRMAPSLVIEPTQGLPEYLVGSVHASQPYLFDTIGDRNGDGYEDFAMASPNEGQLFIFYGSDRFFGQPTTYTSEQPEVEPFLFEFAQPFLELIEKLLYLYLLIY